VIQSFLDKKPKIHADAFVAPTAVLVGDVELEAGASVWFYGVIRADNDKIMIGQGSNVQDGAVLHTDPGYALKVGPNVTIGHKAVLHGCTVGEGSLIGINAVVLNGAKIGKYSIVGANALVKENFVVPDFSLAVGSPAKVVRQLSDDERQKLLQSAKGYQEKSRVYRTLFASSGNN
jgi:carbonic anhydrase/acetyltransferase-like protein (isoleucine patch superfamily)